MMRHLKGKKAMFFELPFTSNVCLFAWEETGLWPKTIIE